jgi:putative transposase
MKKTRFTEPQIIKILQEAEAGRAVPDLCREHGIHESTYYNWKKKYGGMQVQEMQRLKQLEDENRKLKQMFAELSLDYKILKDVVEKKL